jgi:hypothetical protein
MSEKRQCNGTAKHTGERCKNAPLRGTTVCKFHGGMAPQVQAAAKRRLAETQAMKMLDQLGADPADDRHPIEHLLGELWQAAVAADYLGSMAVMDGPKGPLWRAWERERDRRARLAKMALEAGVEERRVRIAEEHALALAGAIRAILANVGAELAKVMREMLVPPEPGEDLIVLNGTDRARLEAAVRNVTLGHEGSRIVGDELRRIATDGDADDAA